MCIDKVIKSEAEGRALSKTEKFYFANKKNTIESSKEKEFKLKLLWELHWISNLAAFPLSQVMDLYTHL